MINEYGVMQGRLLPKYKNRYQSHPVGTWNQEFSIAKKLGLSYIEFILDYDGWQTNPLMSDIGVREILKEIEQNSIGVRSICADIFMELPLHSRNISIARESTSILLSLIKNAAKLGVTDIVIPCVDQSALLSVSDQSQLVKNLLLPLDLANKMNINLALETDLPPRPFLDLLNEFDSNALKVNYDLGNSASMGFDVFQEFKFYGNRISDIHIKDRELAGASVELGNGNANFSAFFQALATIEFKGLIVMQAYRDDEGVEIFKKQFNWFKKKVENEYNCYYSG